MVFLVFNVKNMALGDFVAYSPSTQQTSSEEFVVPLNASAPSINVGEPVVLAAVGSAFVVASHLGTFGTGLVVGIATGGSNTILSATSTETTTVAGRVMVQSTFKDGDSFLVKPTTPSLWNTQALYNANQNLFVPLNYSSTAGYTVGTAFAAGAVQTEGLVVQHLDVTAFPAKVRVVFTKGLNYLS